MTHTFVRKLTTIGSDNGLSPGQCQAINWTIPGVLLIGPPGTIFSGIFNWKSHIFIQENVFENVVCEMAANLPRPQYVKRGLYMWWMYTNRNLFLFCDYIVVPPLII